MAELRYRTGETEPHEELSPQEARQGRRGMPVLLVLVGSLAIATVALIALMSWVQI